jgi:D-glycero-D-manno-heptose 1,7-bisphosphate phosphatase
VVPELSVRCDCRKPAPGMLLDAARELEIDLAASWMLGDTDSDMQAGAAAGCRTVLIEHPGSAHKRGSAQEPGSDRGRRDRAGQPDAIVPDLAAAAALILPAG